ncbi:MAG: Uma2 family endonuclease [Rhodospirillaceae bacterium]
MSEPQRQPWLLDDFLEWEERQPLRYELVDGRPVMMTGGTQAHSLITLNIATALRQSLRGSGCRPGAGDLRVPIRASGRVRYPDVTVDCGRFDPNALDASEPRVVIEVLSKSTAYSDQHAKLRDYDLLESVAHYVIVWQDEPKAALWTRSGGHLVPEEAVSGLEGVLTLAALGVTLTLADIYDGLVFDGPVFARAEA